jgi:ribosomal protein S18 acetylase RimI-like enzyme
MSPVKPNEINTMMPPELQVFKTSLEDVPLVAPLFDAYRVFYGQPSDLKLAETFLCDRLKAGESVIFFCRQSSSNAVIGFTQLYPSFSSVAADRIWILNDLFVCASARRLGVGRILVQAAHNHACGTGAVRVVLSTAHTNEAAQALYESLGYVYDTEFRSYFFATGLPIDRQQAHDAGNARTCHRPKPGSEFRLS